MNKGWAVYYKAEGEIKYLSTDNLGGNIYVSDRSDAKIFDTRKEAENRKKKAESVWFDGYCGDFFQEIEMQFFIDDLSKPLLHDELEALRNL